MNTEIKSKYAKVPTEPQLAGIIEYFTKNADENGVATFTQKEMIQDESVSAVFNTPSYLNAVLTHLFAEGYVEKLHVGARGMPSQWNVTKLITATDIETRVPAKRGPRGPYKNRSRNVEIEVVKKPEPQEDIPSLPVTSTDNKEVMKEITAAMNQMTGYLQQLPLDMGAYLRNLSDKLQLADEDAINALSSSVTQLKAEKEDLQKEVQRLNAQLEEVSGTGNYNKHHIYRQRNLVMDEVDRMISSPAWTIRNKGVKWRQSIETKLDEIMKEIGVTDKL